MREPGFDALPRCFLSSSFFFLNNSVVTSGVSRLESLSMHPSCSSGVIKDSNITLLNVCRCFPGKPAKRWFVVQYRFVLSENVKPNGSRPLRLVYFQTLENKAINVKKKFPQFIFFSQKALSDWAVGLKPLHRQTSAIHINVESHETSRYTFDGGNNSVIIIRLFSFLDTSMDLK